VTSAVRLSGGSIDSTRIDIWSYTLRHKSALDWILGHGFGSNGWFEFFSEWKSNKILLSPHSAVLEFSGALGLLGMFAYFIFSAFLIVSFLRLRGSIIGPGAVVALGFIMLREQVTASYILSPSVLSGMFWILVGVLFAQTDTIKKL
jgi:hypothetical protein